MIDNKWNEDSKWNESPNTESQKELNLEEKKNSLCLHGSSEFQNHKNIMNSSFIMSLSF